MGYCANCDTHHKELLKTAYGDYLCVDCWDEYINTGTGRLEYLIGICNGDYPMDEFDADFLGEVALSYRLYYNLLDLTPSQRLELEDKARELGLL
jgi:hypothetical protein